MIAERKTAARTMVPALLLLSLITMGAARLIGHYSEFSQSVTAFIALGLLFCVGFPILIRREKQIPGEWHVDYVVDKNVQTVKPYLIIPAAMRRIRVPWYLNSNWLFPIILTLGWLVAVLL